jgi:hypothetical protein
LRQVTLAQAAYTIQHPHIRSTDEPALAAGLGAAVQAYRKLVVAHPEDRQPDWDDIDFAERTNRARESRPEGAGLLRVRALDA